MAKKKKICLTDEEIERAGAAWARGDAAPAIKIKLNLKQAGEVLGSASDVLNATHNVLKKFDPSAQFNSDLRALAETYGKAHSVIQAWEEEAKILFHAAENVGIGDVDKLAEHIRNNPPSASAIALLILVVQDSYRELDEKKRRDDFQPVREQGTETKKKKAKTVLEYIALVNADLLENPLPKIGLGLKARANYITEQMPKLGHKKKNGDPYKFNYVRSLIMKLDKTNQT